METPETKTVRLRGWESFDEASESIRALLFGALADLAWPIVEQYRSDLYHDARWIAEHVHGATVFWFNVRKWGTEIGADEPTLRIANDIGGGELYRVELRCEYPEGGGPDAPEEWRRRGYWFADITPEVTDAVRVVRAGGGEA